MTTLDLTVSAARACLEEADVAPQDIDLLLLASTGVVTGEAAGPARELARRLGARRSLTVRLSGQENGTAMAMDLAVAKLKADVELTLALVCTADSARGQPGRHQRGPAAASGVGGAVLLGRDEGILRLEAIVSAAAVDRGLDVNRLMALAGDRAAIAPSVDRTSADGMVAQADWSYLEGLTRHHVRRVVTQALASAGRPGGEGLEFVMLPPTGRALLSGSYRPALDGLGIPLLISPGNRVGLAWAGDVAGDLAHIHRRALLRPGEAALLISAGNELSWTALVVSRPGRPGRPVAGAPTDLTGAQLDDRVQAGRAGAVDRTPSPFSPATVGPSDGPAGVELDVGDVVTVELPEVPGSGYRWSVTSDGAPVVETRPAGLIDVGGGVGAGGIRRFRVEARRVGNADLVFELARAWETSTEARYAVRVAVRE